MFTLIIVLLILMAMASREPAHNVRLPASPIAKGAIIALAIAMVLLMTI